MDKDDLAGHGRRAVDFIPVGDKVKNSEECQSELKLAIIRIVEICVVPFGVTTSGYRHYS